LNQIKGAVVFCTKYTTLKSLYGSLNNQNKKHTALKRNLRSVNS